jgi:hypothetical protein
VLATSCQFFVSEKSLRDRAAAVYQKLGFSLTPRAAHEDRMGTSNRLPELRWFWSISFYVNPMLGITTSGRAQSLEEAKAQFLASLGEMPRRLDS